MILDLRLPGMDGLDVARVLRRDSDVPIIMLTARAEEADRLIGLELGADDYVTKPFSPRELVARVRAIFRRLNSVRQQPDLIRAGDLEIDLAGYELNKNGHPIRLTPLEFNILTVMADRPGQTFTRAQLIDRLHDLEYAGYDRSIDSHIKNLRRKIKDDPSDPQYVLTVYGVGYKFTTEL